MAPHQAPKARIDDVNKEIERIVCAGTVPRIPRVLVADDLDAANSLVALLSQNGYEASAVYTGIDAAEKARLLRPDLLILEVALLGLNGVEAALRICEILLWPCHILLISSNENAADLIEDARDRGYKFEWLAKPFLPSALLQWCDRVGHGHEFGFYESLGAHGGEQLRRNPAYPHTTDKYDCRCTWCSQRWKGWSRHREELAMLVSFLGRKDEIVWWHVIFPGGVYSEGREHRDCLRKGMRDKEIEYLQKPKAGRSAWRARELLLYAIDAERFPSNLVSDFFDKHLLIHLGFLLLIFLAVFLPLWSYGIWWVFAAGLAMVPSFGWYVRVALLATKPHSLFSSRFEALREEIESGCYDPDELARRFRQFERHGLVLRSLFYTLLPLGGVGRIEHH